jgi:hypothetical protein
LPQQIKNGYIQRHSCGWRTATVADTELYYKSQYPMRIFFLLAVVLTATAAAAEKFINAP